MTIQQGSRSVSDEPTAQDLAAAANRKQVLAADERMAHPKSLFVPTWPTTRSVVASSRHRGNTVSFGVEVCGSTGAFSHTLFIIAHIEYQP